MKTKTKRGIAVLGRLWFPIFFAILIALDLAFRYLYFTDDSISVFSLTPALFSVCWALIFCAAAYALPAAARRVFIVLVTAAVSLLCVTHAVMYNLFGSFFSFADLAYAGDGAKFFSFSYLVVRPVFLVCAALALAGAILIAIALPKEKYRLSRLAAAAAVIAAAAAAIYFFDSRLEANVSQELTWDNTSVAVADSDAYHTLSNTNRALSASGIYQFTFRSASAALGLDAGSSEELWDELDEFYASSDKKDHPLNEMSGVFQGKNLIMITMESIDTWMVTEDYMPNLYALQQESISFEKHYTPLYISAGTFCTEFIANTGLVMPSTGIDVSVYEGNSFPFSLANLFNAQGYMSNSFHAASATIYNRGEVHRNLGFAAYHSYSDMGMDNYMLDSQMINGYDLMVSDSPFFSFILTISAHGSYIDDAWLSAAEPHLDEAAAAVDLSSLPESCTNTDEYIRAVAQAMETDKFIGLLVDRLEQDGHIGDTVLVLFGDHYAKYITNHDFLMDLKGVDNSDMLCRTPLMIYSRGTPAEKVEKVTSTCDIVPTLANLFGLDADYACCVGDDAFGDGGGYVVFPGNNWYDGNIYYSAGYTGEMTEYISSRSREISEKMEASWDTLRSDYFVHAW